jgi:uncharacterized protein YqgC (DUF456 family)
MELSVPPVPPDLVGLMQLAGLLLLLLGFVGIVAPILPGPVLIWLGALLWAWADGFVTMGWGTLLLLGVMGLAALGADVVLSTWGARRGGASWRSLLFSSVASLVGLLVLSLPGAVLGAVGGLLLAETVRLGGPDGFREAWRSSGGMILGWALSIAAQIVIGLTMIAIFAWRVLG